MHDTEEEQIEAMKKWWEENGKSVIFGLCIGVVAIVGWNVWSSHKVEQGQEASSLYTKLSQNVDTDLAYAETLNATIQDDFSSTVYAQLSEMKLAKVKLASKDQAAAIAHLQKVVGSATGEMQHVAKLRLARLLRDKGELDQAMTLVEGYQDGAFSGLYAEIQGDLYVAKGDTEKAAAAYQKAIVAGAAKEDWVQMKLDALGVAK